MAVTKPTVADVRVIIDTDLLDASVQVYIDDAAVLVNTCILPLTADAQTAVIKYVAAHLVSVRDAEGGSGVVVSEKLGDAQTSYAAMPLGKQLQSSTYGQSALLFDPNGCLANLGAVAAKVRLV